MILNTLRIVFTVPQEKVAFMAPGGAGRATHLFPAFNGSFRFHFGEMKSLNLHRLGRHHEKDVRHTLNILVPRPEKSGRGTQFSDVGHPPAPRRSKNGHLPQAELSWVSAFSANIAARCHNSVRASSSPGFIFLLNEKDARCSQWPCMCHERDRVVIPGSKSSTTRNPRRTW
jgi:hypothetical protein